jgi:prepilin-type N-terminal cleavage/methylation domain-containing protein
MGKTYWRDERGFTLPEALATVAILGILLAIAIIVWLGLVESRRVDAAANQLASDLRLAHTSAANQLTDWRVVLVPERAEEGVGADYYLIKLNEPYDPGDPKPTLSPGASSISRTLPANVKIMTQTNAAGTPIIDNIAQTYYLSPSAGAGLATRTLEFNSDGAMTGYGGSPSGTVRVTIDDEPRRLVRYISATSRIKLLP